MSDSHMGDKHGGGMGMGMGMGGGGGGGGVHGGPSRLEPSQSSSSASGYGRGSSVMPSSERFESDTSGGEEPPMQRVSFDTLGLHATDHR